MNSTTIYPATAPELIRIAAVQGVAPSELLAGLPTPPDGFRLCASSEELPGGDWDGPKFEGAGWKVTSHWTAREGVTFYVDGDRDNAIPAVEAGKIAAALAEVAALASA